jgi:hypothetical protein
MVLTFLSRDFNGIRSIFLIGYTDRAQLADTEELP